MRNSRASVSGARLLSLFALVVVVAASLCYLLYPRTYWIEVSLQQEGGVLYQAPVEQGDHFTYSFIHSVEKKKVDEVFEIGRDHRIYLVETAFGSLGAGLPYDAAGEVVVEDGLIKVSGLNRPVPKLNLKPSSFTSCTLTFGETELDLSVPGVAGKMIEVRVVESGLVRR